MHNHHGSIWTYFLNAKQKSKLELYSFPEKKTKLFSKLVLANKDGKSRKYLLTLIPLHALTRTMLCLLSAILLPNSAPQWTPNTFYSTFDKFNLKRSYLASCWRDHSKGGNNNIFFVQSCSQSTGLVYYKRTVLNDTHFPQNIKTQNFTLSKVLRIMIVSKNIYKGSMKKNALFRTLSQIMGRRGSRVLNFW